MRSIHRHQLTYANVVCLCVVSPDISPPKKKKSHKNTVLPTFMVMICSAAPTRYKLVIAGDVSMSGC